MDVERTEDDAPPNRALRGFTGYLLRRAYVAAVEAAKVTVPPPHRMRELLILLLLRERGPVSQQELATILQLNRTIMVGLVDGLEDRGLVRRERNPADRRSYALVLTGSGRRTLRTLEPAVAQADAALTVNLTAPERQRLNAALRRTIPDLDAVGPGTLSGHTGFLLKHAHYSRRESAAEALAPLQIEPREFGALVTLQELQPCSQQELATGLGVSPPVVLQLVDELEQAGLVRRNRNDHDRRVYDLTLTAAGERTVIRAFELLAELRHDPLASPGDRELHELLVKLLG